MVTSSSRLTFGTAIAVALIAVGCDLTPWTSESEAAVYACDESVPLGTCVEHGRLSPDSVDYGRNYCEAREGRWLVNEPCPTADRFGSCDWAPRGGGVQYYYSNCTWCDRSGQSCTSQGGVWTSYP
jgi:hypothetical protein